MLRALPPALLAVLSAGCVWISDEDMADRRDQDGDGQVDVAFGGTDCDDADPLVGEGFSETCDGIDNNCDGAVDEGVLLRFLPDRDGDGYGDDSAATVEACEAPPEHVATVGDCDDADPATRPGVEEICGDGIDNNCDGGGAGCALTGELVIDEADALVLGEAYHDNFGISMGSPGDVTGDGVPDLVVGSRGLEDAKRFVVLDALPEGEVPVGEVAAASLGGVVDLPGGQLNVATGAPTPASGCADLLVGLSTVDLTEEEGGSSVEADGLALLFSCPVPAFASFEDADTRLTSSAWQFLGDSVAWLGDPDEDGEATLLIGSLGFSTQGAVFVREGPFPANIDLQTDADLILNADTYLGASEVVSIGDATGDGLPDIVIGTPYATGATGGGTAGGAMVVSGEELEATGALLMEDVALLMLRGQSAEDRAGDTLARAGDVDNDGLEDFLVGAPRAGTDAGELAGSVWLVRGAGPTGTGEARLQDQHARFDGDTAEGRLGTSLAGGQDTDGVSGDDLLLGQSNDAEGAGRAWLIVGDPGSGVHELGGGVASAVLRGDSPGVGAGLAVALPGDLDGDGVSELAVGAPRRANAELEEAGAVALFRGGGM
jgi:hypothetical protein